MIPHTTHADLQLTLNSGAGLDDLIGKNSMGIAVVVVVSLVAFNQIKRPH